MAKNTGNGYRIGAVTDRLQILNRATGLWTVICRSTGRIMRNQKTKAEGITVMRLPKKSGSL